MLLPLVCPDAYREGVNGLPCGITLRFKICDFIPWGEAFLTLLVLLTLFAHALIIKRPTQKHHGGFNI